MKNWKRILLTAAAALALGRAFGEVWRTAWGSGFDLWRFSFKWLAALAGLLLVYTGLLAVAVLAVWRLAQLARLEDGLMHMRERLGRARFALAGLLLAFPAWLLLYSPWGDVFTGFFFRLVLLLAACGLAAALFGRGPASLDWGDFIVAALLAGALFALTKLFVNVTDHPFSLAWSEGNRLYDYSVLWGRHLYNYPAEANLRAAIDPGRQALWGLPWLLMDAPSIWLARLWGALVVGVPYILLGLFAVQPGEGRRGWLLFGLWTFLFLNQGPIYTPLVLAGILVAAGRRLPLWLNFILVALAGYYAYTSRLSWMFAPALWAAMLALAGGAASQPARREWGRALALGFAGVLGSFGFTLVLPPLWQYARNLLSGTATGAPANPAAVIAGQVTQGIGDVIDMSEQIATQQTLLWQRLLPNASFGLGVLLGLLLAALPLILLLALLARRREWPLGLWKALAILVPQAAFLAVGLAASVKVGGGLDLHNLDMFLVGLALVAGLAWEAGAGARLLAMARAQAAVRAGLLLAVLIPAFVPMVDARPLALPELDKTAAALTTVREFVSCAAQHGEVLFMDQRQLLTFGLVENVPLTPAYEKKQVMDQALSANDEYFQAFYADLAAGRFSLIVTERQAAIYKDAGTSLAEENNAWVAWVTEPLLTYYESVADYRTVRVELFMPIGRDYDCPLP